MKSSVWFVALFFALLAPLAAGATFNVPSEVPENANWDVSIQTGTPSFDRLVLFLEGDRMASLYVFDDSDVLPRIDDQRVVRVAYGDGLFRATLSGLLEGTYEIGYKTYHGAEVSESEETQVTVYQAFDREQAQQEIEQIEQQLSATTESLDEQVSTLSSNLSGVTQALDDIESSLTRLENRVEGAEGLEGELSDLRVSIDALNAALANLRAQADALVAEDSSVRSELDAINIELSAVEEQVAEDNLDFVGLVNFSQNAVLGLIILILVSIVAVAYYGFARPGEERETLFSTQGTYAEEEEAEGQSEEEAEEPETGGASLLGGFSAMWPFGKGKGKTGLAVFGDPDEAPEDLEDEDEDEEDEDEEGEGEEEGPTDQGLPDVESKGKFAYDPDRKPARPQKEEGKGFNLGELIKKNDRP